MRFGSGEGVKAFVLSSMRRKEPIPDDFRVSVRKGFLTAPKNRMISLEDGREETYTYDNYGWTEHISRKWGQWHPGIDELLDNFKECGLDLERE